MFGSNHFLFTIILEILLSTFYASSKYITIRFCVDFTFCCRSFDIDESSPNRTYFKARGVIVDYKRIYQHQGKQSHP